MAGRNSVTVQSMGKKKLPRDRQGWTAKCSFNLEEQHYLNKPKRKHVTRRLVLKRVEEGKQVGLINQNKPRRGVM